MRGHNSVFLKVAGILWVLAFLLCAPLGVWAHSAREDAVAPPHAREDTKAALELAKAAPPGVATMATTCTTCHGENGISPGSIPSLAGRDADELAAILMSFKAGLRPATIMRRIIGPFSRSDIEALAKYFSLRKGPPQASIDAKATDVGGMP